MEKFKKYRTEDLIVYWNLSLCSHAGICTARMPHVFCPDKRPWICLDGADPLEIIRTIDKCPTGALRYQLTDNAKIDPSLAKGPGWIDYKVSEPAIVEIKIVSGGPLLVKGPVRVLDPEGNSLRECESLVLCRCGKTKNPPFCDGSHSERD